MIKNIVEQFLQDNLKGFTRLYTLKRILTENEIEYKVVKNRFATNVVIGFNSFQKKRIVLGAHYDVYSTSTGINDNTVAVATIIKLIKNIDKTKLPLDIVFFDREETGMLGSKLYINITKKEFIEEALILDVIGYGDVLAFSGNTKLTTKYFNKFNSLPSCILSYELPSDNIVFNRHRIPSTLLVVVPNEDLTLKWKDNPEICVLKPTAEFYETFHNRTKDNDINIINWELVDLIYTKLVDIYG